MLNIDYVLKLFNIPYLNKLMCVLYMLPYKFHSIQDSRSLFFMSCNQVKYV